MNSRVVRELASAVSSIIVGMPSDFGHFFHILYSVFNNLFQLNVVMSD